MASNSTSEPGLGILALALQAINHAVTEKEMNYAALQSDKNFEKTTFKLIQTGFKVCF